MSKTLVLTDTKTYQQIEVDIWDNVILFTPDTEDCVLLEANEVRRLRDYLSAYLKEVKND